MTTHRFHNRALAVLAAIAARADLEMTAMTDVLEGNVVMHCFRTGTWAKPAALLTALYTAMPGETGGGTEVTGGSYARAACGNGAPLDANWAAPAGGNGTTNNLAAITFPAPTANWGTIVGMGEFFDTVLWLYGALTVNKTVNNGDAAPNFPIGSLVFVFA